MRLEKGSWGLQIGAQTIDLVLLVMNKSGAEAARQQGVARRRAVGRRRPGWPRRTRRHRRQHHGGDPCRTPARRDSLPGINLSGGVLRGDTDDNKDLYGVNVNAARRAARRHRADAGGRRAADESAPKGRLDRD